MLSRHISYSSWLLVHAGTGHTANTDREQVSSYTTLQKAEAEVESSQPAFISQLRHELINHADNPNPTCLDVVPEKKNCLLWSYDEASQAEKQEWERFQGIKT